MEVLIHENHLAVHDSIARKFNVHGRKYSRKRYSKIGDYRPLLEARIPLREKKEKLMSSLSNFLVETLAVNKEAFTKKDLQVMSLRLCHSRSMINRLRAINYFIYSELKLQSRKEKGQESWLNKSRKVRFLGKDELEMLEYTAYRMIQKATRLDKKLLKEYSKKESTILKKEKSEIRDLGHILRKEMSILEHLESQLPPSSFINMALLRDPLYTRWVSRVLSLVAYLMHFNGCEKKLPNELVKIIHTDKKLEKKIGFLKKEQESLIRILENKSSFLESDDDFGNLKTTINL